MKKVIILAVLCLISQSSWAQIREFQTTRLNSTAGTGVASVLSTEAAILNPAGSAFFEGSSASYQKHTTTLKDENPLRFSLPDKFAKHNTSQGLFLADHSGELKGGVAYLVQDENNYERERMILHAAAAIGSSTSMGFSYKYTSDKRPNFFKHRHKTFHQATIGAMHILDQDTIIGLIVVDPTRSNAGDERVIAGFQYNLSQKFMLIGDAGMQYTKALSQDYLWSGAVQLNLFSDFFLRAGKFYDNVTKFKGMGWGLAWIGPKLGVEFSQRFSDQFATNSYIYEDETLVDTSLSALLKF